MKDDKTIEKHDFLNTKPRPEGKRRPDALGSEEIAQYERMMGSRIGRELRFWHELEPDRKTLILLAAAARDLTERGRKPDEAVAWLRVALDNLAGYFREAATDPGARIKPVGNSERPTRSTLRAALAALPQRSTVHAVMGSPWEWLSWDDLDSRLAVVRDFLDPEVDHDLTRWAIRTIENANDKEIRIEPEDMIDFIEAQLLPMLQIALCLDFHEEERIFWRDTLEKLRGDDDRAN